MEALSSAPGSVQRLPELDGLRGVAALAVVMAHYTPATPTADKNPTPYLFNAIHAFSLANIGVLFFFGLSSFLLTWLAEERFIRKGSFEASQFLIHRFFRIVPLYLAVLAISLFLIRDNGWLINFNVYDVGERRYTVGHIWVYLLFLYNWVDALLGFRGYHPDFFNEFNHLWTLSVEVQFYLLFAAFYAALRASLGTIPALVARAVLCGVAMRAGFILVTSLASPGQAGSLYFYSFSYLEVFVLSSAAGILFARRANLTDRFGLLRRPGLGLATVVTLAALGWVWKYFLWGAPDSETTAGKVAYYGVSIILYSILGIAIAASLLWLGANTRSRLSGVLRLPLLQALGTLSYGIYMWHLPAKFLIYGLDKRLLHGLDGQRRVVGVFLMFLVYVAFVLALAGLTFWGVEAPSNRFRRYLDSRRDGVPRLGNLGRAPLPLVLLGSGVGGAAILLICSLRL